MIKGVESQSAVCSSRYSAHRTQARKWKEDSLEAMQTQFLEKGKVLEIKKRGIDRRNLQKSRPTENGVGLAQKNLKVPKKERRKLIEPNRPIPIIRQCRLLECH